MDDSAYTNYLNLEENRQGANRPQGWHTKVNTTHPEGQQCVNSVAIRLIVSTATQTHKCESHEGTKRKVRGSKENLMDIHQKVPQSHTANTADNNKQIEIYAENYMTSFIFTSNVTCS